MPHAVKSPLGNLFEVSNLLVDIHTNLFWYPDHLTDEFVDASWEAKRAKMRLTNEVHCDVTDRSYRHNFDCRPEQLLAATEGCDKVVVFAIDAPFTGIRGDQEAVAKFAREHSDRFQGWCSVDPNRADCVERLRYCVEELGLKGLKLGPIYQNFNPQDPRHLPLFREAERLNIPINWHQGTSFVRKGPLKYSNPILLEDIAIACPNLRMIISHMGHPWEDECVVLIRKHLHLYADTSALHYRPLSSLPGLHVGARIWCGAQVDLRFRFSIGHAEAGHRGLWKVNEVVSGSSFPRFPDEAIHNIIYENWKSFNSKFS
jgi:uncharacterized protein